MRALLPTMLAAGLLALPAKANDDLAVYAAFAKFEANISELTLAATAFAALDDSYDEARAEKREEFEEDVEQVAAYVEMLRGMDLGDEQTAALDRFVGKWAALVAAGEAMIAGDAASMDDVAALFEMAEAADEAIDDVLDDMLDDMGVSLPGDD